MSTTAAATIAESINAISSINLKGLVLGHSERQSSHAHTPSVKLPPLTKNYVDDNSDEGDQYLSSASTNSASGGSEIERELLFQEGPDGFSGMLPGLGWYNPGAPSALNV